MSRGRFITLEGGEGAGKSTNARFIKAWLERQGRSVILTREPGGSPLAEAIRGVVLQSWEEGVPPMAEALLMFAARSAHLEATVLPALAAGKDVICDRFVDSSYAYQGAGKGFSIARLEALEKMVLENLQPDLTIVFDLDPEIGLQRARSRGEQNRFEDETLAFMNRVRQEFLDRAAAQPARYAVLNAGRELEVTQSDLLKILEARL
jgi:dTMP kinase